MSPVSRGFHRKREAAPADRVPPGQYVTRDFPVLSAGPTPHTPLARWSFSITATRYINPPWSRIYVMSVLQT